MEGSIFDLQEIWQSIVTRARESEDSTSFADYLEKTYIEQNCIPFMIVISNILLLMEWTILQ